MRVHKLPSPSDLAAVSANGVASFTFVLYDFLLTLDDEIEIIWPKPMRSWVKWKFLFLRYFSIAVQLVNFAIERTAMPFSHGSGSSIDRIYGFLIAQVVTCFVTSAAVELLLMTRIYAVYNKNTYIASACTLLLAGQLVAMSICIVRRVEMRNASDVIDLDPLSGTFPYLGVTTLASQSVLVVLTIIKHCKAVRQGAKSSVMTLLLRDGILAFLASTLITCLTVVTIIYSSVYAVISYFWLVSISASLGCRIIINLERWWEPSQVTPPGPTLMLTELSTAFFAEESYP